MAPSISHGIFNNPHWMRGEHCHLPVTSHSIIFSKKCKRKQLNSLGRWPTMAITAVNNNGRILLLVPTVIIYLQSFSCMWQSYSLVHLKATDGKWKHPKETPQHKPWEISVFPKALILSHWSISRFSIRAVYICQSCFWHNRSNSFECERNDF